MLGLIEARGCTESHPVLFGLTVKRKQSALKEKHVSHKLGDSLSGKCQPNVCPAVAISLALKLSP